MPNDNVQQPAIEVGVTEPKVRMTQAAATVSLASALVRWGQRTDVLASALEKMDVLVRWGGLFDLR